MKEKCNKNKGFKSTISTKTKKQKKLSHLSSSRILPLFSGEKNHKAYQKHYLFMPTLRSQKLCVKWNHSRLPWLSQFLNKNKLNVEINILKLII